MFAVPRALFSILMLCLLVALPAPLYKFIKGPMPPAPDCAELEIPKHLLEYLLVQEDDVFLRHSGMQLSAVIESARENLLGLEYVRGASTISMQLAKNLYLSSDKTLWRKLEQGILALLLEARFTKCEIIQHYVCTADFGLDAPGIEHAAKTLFSHSVAELTHTEALLLVRALKNPRLFPPKLESVTQKESRYLENRVIRRVRENRRNVDPFVDALTCIGPARDPAAPASRRWYQD
jgi:membrane peptidoglycan carboxypeptidase